MSPSTLTRPRAGCVSLRVFVIVSDSMSVCAFESSLLFIGRATPFFVAGLTPNEDSKSITIADL